MAQAFTLPDLGEGIHEGEVIAVLVSVGDEVKEGDLILEVETDKAAVELPSPFTGKVREIHVKRDDVVTVGQVLLTFGDGEAAEPAPAEKPVESETKEDDQPPAGREEEPVPASPATRRSGGQGNRSRCTVFCRKSRDTGKKAGGCGNAGQSGRIRHD